MKKILTLAVVTTALITPIKSYASDDTSKVAPSKTEKVASQEGVEAIKRVKDFYLELQSNMNKPDYDKALEIVKKHFAKDFLHYDDGEVSYGKDGMILFVENHKKNNVRTEMNIDIFESSFNDEVSEVRVKFNISQKFFKKNAETGEEIEDIAGRINLTCTDDIRYTDKDNFELYKCDCITVKSEDSTETAISKEASSEEAQDDESSNEEAQDEKASNEENHSDDDSSNEAPNEEENTSE